MSVTLYADVPCTPSGARSLVDLLGDLLPSLETGHVEGLYLLEKLRRELRGELDLYNLKKAASDLEEAHDNRPTIREIRL